VELNYQASLAQAQEMGQQKNLTLLGGIGLEACQKKIWKDQVPLNPTQVQGLVLLAPSPGRELMSQIFLAGIGIVASHVMVLMAQAHLGPLMALVILVGLAKCHVTVFQRESPLAGIGPEIGHRLMLQDLVLATCSQDLVWGHHRLCLVKVSQWSPMFPDGTGTAINPEPGLVGLSQSVQWMGLA